MCVKKLLTISFYVIFNSKVEEVEAIEKEVSKGVISVEDVQNR